MPCTVTKVPVTLQKCPESYQNALHSYKSACHVTEVPWKLPKCPAQLQKCLSRYRSALLCYKSAWKKIEMCPFLQLSLSLSLPLFNTVFVIALLWVFFVIMCEGWGEVDSWKHRVVQLAPYILSSKHFFMLFYQTFSPTFSTQNLGERIDELRL